METRSEDDRLYQRALGTRIHMCRRAAGLSQKELAQRCGFPYQVINRIEKGHQDLYTRRLTLIALHLGVSTDYLVGLSAEEVRRGRLGNKRINTQRLAQSLLELPAFRELPIEDED